MVGPKEAVPFFLSQCSLDRGTVRSREKEGDLSNAKFSQVGLCSILGGKKQRGRWWHGGCACGLWNCAPGGLGAAAGMALFCRQ